MSTPKHTPIQTAVINSSIDAKLFHTYARLVMLAWRHDFKYTDWLRQSDLEMLIGLDWSNIKRHTAELKRAGLIYWTTNGKSGRRFFIVEVRLEDGAKAQYCAPSSSGGVNTSVNSKDQLPLLDEAQICALSLMLDQESWDALRAAGVGEPARTELSNLPHVNPHYIKAMAAQAQRDGVGIGALVFRIHNDWPAPELCERCGGLDGEHADACPTQAERRAREAVRLESREAPAQQPQADDENTRIWRLTLEQLQLQLTGATFDTWLRRTSLISVEDGIFTIAVHNGYAKEWLENRLDSMIKRTLTGIVGQPVEVRFVVSELAQVV